MILPNNVNPKLTIYYNSYKILLILKEVRKMHFINLYEIFKKEENLSFSLFVLCLDWLFLIELAIIVDDGRVELCTSKD